MSETNNQSPVRIVESAKDLSQISQEGTGGVIWQRQLPSGFRSWIDSLDPTTLPSVRAVLPPDEIRTLVTNVCDAANTPNCLNRDWFIDDVCALANTFLNVMGTPYVQLRFDVVADNACRKFHMDMVRARLICTYRGSGTQYGTSHDDADPENIQDVPLGDPILLRGHRWPSTGSINLRHRSPPIAGTGETRLIMVLDAIEHLEDPRKVEISGATRRINETGAKLPSHTTEYRA